MINYKLLGAAELSSLLDPEKLMKAEREALQNARNKAATFVSKKVREDYNVQAGAISKRVNLGWKDGSRKEARIDWVGTRIGEINFAGKSKRVNSSRGSRMGATYRLKKSTGAKLSYYNGVGGFIATGNSDNTHIFARRFPHLKVKSKKTGRMILSRDIYARTGPAIPQMVSGPEVVQAAEQFVVEEYPDQLQKKLIRFFEIQSGLR